MTDQELELRLTLVTALATTVIFNECLDELKESTFYKKNLKIAGKQFEIQITRECEKQLKNMFHGYDNVPFQLTNSIRDIGAYVAKLPPDEIIIFAQSLKK